MPKFRKKPVVIEAVQWTGNNLDEVIELGSKSKVTEYGEDFTGDNVFIKTLEGEMTASKGDYIILGIKGELYPCKPDIFEATYEPVED